MKRLLVALVLPLLFVAGCGDSDDEGPASTPTSAQSTDAVAGALDETCAKLARTWAVKAGGLRSGLYLLVDRVSVDVAAMTDATDQMEIEGCEGDAVSTALRGNYEAALAVAKMQVCLNDGEELSCDAAGDSWVKNGEPLVDKVKALSAP